MGRLFTSKAAKATKEWLRNQYEAYPQGIQKVYKQRRSDKIHVRLKEPLDIGYLTNIVEGHGFEFELTQDNGTNVLQVYDVIEEDGTLITKTLNSVFREQRDVSIGTNPVQDNSVHPRLVLTCDYLRGKYR